MGLPCRGRASGMCTEARTDDFPANAKERTLMMKKSFLLHHERGSRYSILVPLNRFDSPLPWHLIKR